MGIYNRHILPRLTHLVCSSRAIARQRRRVVPLAVGRVLEVGFGSGLNLPFYDPAGITRLWGLEPERGMWRLARRHPGAPPLEPLQARAEAIPLADGCADTVVATFTLCSVGDPLAALREMRRVLAPGGRLLFCEHGLAPEPAVQRWQRRLTPLWRRAAGGCRLDRDVPALLTQAGWRIRTLETGYLEGPRVAGFNFWGAAEPL